MLFSLQLNYLLVQYLLKCQSLSHVQLFATPGTVACQAPLSTEFSRQECWNGQLFPSLGDLPNPGIEPGSSALQAMRESEVAHFTSYQRNISHNFGNNETLSCKNKIQLKNFVLKGNFKLFFLKFSGDMVCIIFKTIWISSNLTFKM